MSAALCLADSDIRRRLLFGGTVFFLGVSGCATIISGSDQAVSVNSVPSGEKFQVREKTGKIVFQGVTPTVVNLKTGAGYFSGAGYTFTFPYTPARTTVQINSHLNGWYFGNLIWPGMGLLVGMVLVDPITGAMWRLPERVDVYE